MVLRSALAFCLLTTATAALAHKGEEVRTLRLQRGAKGFEALLSITIPPGVKAQALLVPPGLMAGEKPGQPLEQLVGQRAARIGLQGLHLSFGAEGAELKPLLIEVKEAKARRTQAGAIEGMALLRLPAELPAGASILEVDVPLGARVRVSFPAPRGAELTLQSGVGRAVKGGLALRPQPGKPCRVRISPGIASNSPP